MSVSLYSLYLVGTLLFQLLSPGHGYSTEAKIRAGTYTSYMLGPVCRPTHEIETPTTTSQVVDIVKSAYRRYVKVKAFGSRHSITDIICTDGIPIDMSQFKETLSFNDSDLSVTVSAGFTLRELGTFLHSNGRTYHGGPSYGGITVGGALGTDAHGSSLNFNTTLSSQTISVKIVDGHGKLKMISSPKEMRAYGCHLGMLGVILEATISTVPDYKITMNTQRLSEDILTTGLWERPVRLHDYTDFHWFPSSQTVVMTTGRIVPVSTPGEAFTNIIPTTTAEYNAHLKSGYTVLQGAENSIGMKSAESLSSIFYSDATDGVSPFLTEDGVTMLNPAAGYRYLIQDSVCNHSCLWSRSHGLDHVTFLTNAVALDLKDFNNVIRTVKDILAVSNATFQFVGIWLRFGLSSDSYLSPSYGRETFYLEFGVIRRDDLYETASTGISTYQAIMQALVRIYLI